MRNSTIAVVCGGLVFATLLGAANPLPIPSGNEIIAEPLATRSGPRGSAMFTPMSAAQTGIVTENPYADPKMWGELYQELVYGPIGCGVAIGDYDGDGRPDVFVVNKTGECRLFRNLGNWKFENVTERAGLNGSGGFWGQGLAWAKKLTGGGSAMDDNPDAWNQGATFVDVNNDGWLDLYVCRFGAPNRLYINQGDGTFKEEAAARGLAVSDASGMAAFCDYDRDGWLDVYIQTNLLNATTAPTGQRDYLFHNNGDGTFTNVTGRAGISGKTQGHSVTWWDYNGDGWPDIYVANDFAPADHLYRNNGNGTFTDVINQTVPHMPHSSMGSDLGDLNNDGLIDFVVADMAATTHQKDQRGMAKIRTLLVHADADAPVAPQYMRNAVYLNTGTGRFNEAAYLTGLNASDWTWSVRLEDLDNDGRLDVYFTNGMIREYHNLDLLDRIMAMEDPNGSRMVMKSSPPLAEANLAFRNLGDLRFESVGKAWGLDQRGVSFGAAFGDLDGDGDLDLVFVNYEGEATVLRNDSDTGHRIVVALRGTKSNRFGVGATVRIESAAGVQVRTLVLARGYLSNSEPILHFGLGEDTVIKKLTVAWPSGQTQTFIDLPVDQRFILTEPPLSVTIPAAGRPPKEPGLFSEVSEAAGLSMAAKEMPPTQIVSQTLIPTRFERRGPGLAVGDVDGDGRDDVVVGATSVDPTRVLRGAAGAAFAQVEAAGQPEPDGGDAGPLLLFDADGDGAPDLLLTAAGTRWRADATEYQPKLLLNNGRGSFTPAPSGTLPALSISAGAVAAADFDRDGHLDLFIGGRVRPGEYPLAPRSALLANRGGRFEDVTEALAPGLREIGMVTSAMWSDVDGDGWPDLLVALEWGGVHYWHNNGGRGFEDWSERAGFSAAGTGWWTSLASADFNGDGRLDYVAGNVGLNTQYHASVEHPALLFYGDFAGNGKPSVIEAYYEGDKLYPWRTRNDLGASIREVSRRFRRNDLYAQATLGEILGEDRLATARRFAATEFRSGVFLSQSDGTFRFEPLPRIAQIAPFQGLVAGDFDGDGHADIYAVQNSYAPIPLVGRFDGGISQLLLGDGHGQFTPVPPAESNLVVPGDAKALVVLDINHDGWPDFLITRNNSTTLAYRNRGVAGRHSLRVALRGGAGNPTAIGARIVMELTDGSKQTGEVQAGSGYYSQSSAAVFFGYPEANPPRSVYVRWPSGATTRHAVAPGLTNLILDAPGTNRN